MRNLRPRTFYIWRNWEKASFINERARKIRYAVGKEKERARRTKEGPRTLFRTFDEG